MPETTSGDVLASYVNAISAEDKEHAQACADEAKILIARALGEDNPHEVPDEIVARCELEVGTELYYRKRTRHGLASFDGVDGAMPLRISRDPMTAAWPLLRQYIPFGLA